VEAHFNRGTLYAKLGELTGAVEDLTEVIRLTPNNSSAYFARGIVLVRNGNLEAGLADLRTTLKLDPGHARAQAGAGTGDQDLLPSHPDSVGHAMIRG
jgi:lipoprotein NlpI